MGQYKVGFYFKYMLAFGYEFEFNEGSLIEFNLYFPFVLITIGLMKGASGVRFFKD